MSREQRGIFFGWVVVAAAFVVAAFGWGLGFYGPPIYLDTVARLEGWSVGLISGAVTLHFLTGALVVANLPALYRRFGLPMVSTAGAVSLAAGITGWAQAFAPWQLVPAALLSGAGWVVLSAAGINAMVAPWFIRRRPAALSMAYNGASIGGVVFSPLWVLLIAVIGFKAATIAVGAVTIVVIAVLSLTVFRRTPEGMGLAPDGGAATAGAGAVGISEPAAVPRLRGDVAYLTLSAGMAIGLFAQIGLIAHLFSLLVPILGAGGAGFAASMATVAALAGRTATGWLMPPAMDRRVIAAATHGVQALGCVALYLAGGATVPLVLLGVLLIGLGIGNGTSLPPLIAQAEFRREEVGRVVALVVATSQATYAFAPATFGLVREAEAAAGTAGGAFVFPAAALVFCASAAVYLLGRDAFRRRA